MLQSELDPNLTFDPEKHHYFYQGLRVPNVTSLLKDYGLIDFTGVPEDRLEYKSALGSAVHYAAFLFDQGNLDEESLHPDIVPYFQGYKKFREITGFEPRYSELKLYSKKWRFAGTLDLQGPFEWKEQEVESIIDIKCSWELYPSNGPQIAAYKLAFEEMFRSIKIKARFVLQLKPNGNYEVDLCKDADDQTTFLSALHLHHWKIRKGILKEE